MTDQELLKAYKDIKYKQWTCLDGGMSRFSEISKEVSRLEEMIVIRWVGEQEMKK